MTKYIYHILEQIARHIEPILVGCALLLLGFLVLVFFSWLYRRFGHLVTFQIPMRKTKIEPRHKTSESEDNQRI